MKHHNFAINLQEERESHEHEMDCFRKEFRETMVSKQNEIEMLTTNLRELQHRFVDNGGGVLYPTSRGDEHGRRPRAKSVQGKMESSHIGSDESSFNIRVPTPSEDRSRVLPIKAS